MDITMIKKTIRAICKRVTATPYVFKVDYDAKYKYISGYNIVNNFFVI